MPNWRRTPPLGVLDAVQQSHRRQPPGPFHEVFSGQRFALSDLDPLGLNVALKVVEVVGVQCVGPFRYTTLGTLAVELKWPGSQSSKGSSQQVVRESVDGLRCDGWLPLHPPERPTRPFVGGTAETASRRTRHQPCVARRSGGQVEPRASCTSTS
jgi:hypothetical protein